MKKLGVLFCLVALLGAWASPASAAPPAARSAAGRGMDGQVSVFGILGYSYYWANAFGVGARYQKILAPDLLRAKIHDDLSIEGGVDVVHSSWDFAGYCDWYLGAYGCYTVNGSYTAVSPVVGLLWNFWLNEKISLYPKLDLGYEFGSVKYESNNPYPGGSWASYYGHEYGGAYLDLAGGIAVKLDVLTLRAQAGIHGLYLGVGFQL